MKRKYFKNKKEAIQAAKESGKEVFKMPKGSRKAGWYAVCDYIEYLNTY